MAVGVPRVRFPAVRAGSAEHISAGDKENGMRPVLPCRWIRYKIPGGMRPDFVRCGCLSRNECMDLCHPADKAGTVSLPPKILQAQEVVRAQKDRRALPGAGRGRDRFTGHSTDILS